MALASFYFQASLPARPESLEALHPLVRQVLTYCGYAAGEARAISDQIERAATVGLSATAEGHVTITFEKDPKDLRISLHARHLSPTAPGKGLMDAVSVHEGKSGPTYRYQRRVPESV